MNFTVIQRCPVKAYTVKFRAALTVCHLTNTLYETIPSHYHYTESSCQSITLYLPVLEQSAIPIPSLKTGMCWPIPGLDHKFHFY